MAETQKAFINRQLEELADEYRIPRSMVPELMDLLEQYSSIEGHGRLNDLVGDLDKLFMDMERAGNLPEA